MSVAMRIRLLEPSAGAVTGGVRLLIHGKGFRPAPHSLVVRFRLLAPELPPSTSVTTATTTASVASTVTTATTVAAIATTTTATLLQPTPAPVRVDVPGKFVMESQLECVVPSFQPEAAHIISQLTRISATSATVLCSPLVLSVQVEVILDSDTISNALLFAVHQPIAIQRLAPQFVLLAPPTSMTATLNLLRLSSAPGAAAQPSRTGTGTGAGASAAALDISALPVFVRVRQVSERTGAVSEHTRAGRWRISSIGVYEVEFDAAMLGFGAASVELTLNRSEYFRGREKAPESLAYRVARDVMLDMVEPCCVNVTSGRMTEVRILGGGFVDTGDLVVQLSQRAIRADAIDTTDDADADAPLLPVAQLNATFVNANELRCSVQPNMPFGLTTFRVSLNGGRQFGKAQVVALLHRDRALESIEPTCGSLEGGTLLTLRHACLPVEDTDSPRQITKLVPPKRIRVRFQAIRDDGSLSDTLVKIVNAESSASVAERGVIRCRAPSFLDDMKAKSREESRGAVAAATRSDRDGDVVLRVKRFRVSVALGGDAFVGALAFGYYFPPVIRSISMHHGPITGDTRVRLRMKFKVPPRLRILVRFQSLALPDVSETVVGVIATGQQSEAARAPHSALGAIGAATAGGISALVSPSHLPEDNPEFCIVCSTPAWTQTMHDLPHLTKVQVSYNGGVEFVPADDAVISVGSPRGPAAANGAAADGAAPVSPRRAQNALCLIKDLSYLYFVFYRPPRLRAISPMSADIHGGSYLRMLGDDIVDHGAPVAVVFQSPHMSRQVAGFIENGEIRCCAPPFNVGLAAIFVSLNAEQFTKCEFEDPETHAPIDFVFYSSPSLRAISPLCACVSMSSVMRISGVNLVETGRIKVRVSFAGHHGKVVFKDVAGRASKGVITAASPLFSSDFADRHATVDVALNGYDFSGTTVALYYYARYTVQRVEPATGAFEIPIPLTLRVVPQIVSDSVQVRVRFTHKATRAAEALFGPVDVRTWSANCIQFELPALDAHIESLEVLASARIEVAFDRAYFHCVGELLELYRVYNIPFPTSIAPLFGPHDRATEVLACGVNLRESDVVKISLYLAPETASPVATVVARVQQKRQLLTWQCPALDQLVADALAVRAAHERMLLPQALSMRISCVDGQQKALPFTFRYYQSPRLVRMSPAVGYICSGSLISFEFLEPIETPTVDFRFGASQVTGGRIRDGRFVECFSPELTKGVHDVAISFNEQHYDFAYIEAASGDDGDDSAELTGASDPSGSSDPSGEVGNPEAGVMNLDLVASQQQQQRHHLARVRATFQAFMLPLFTLPENRHRIFAFGPMAGGTMVHVKGRGFIAEAKIYVRFCSPFKSGFGDNVSEVIVNAKVLDHETIQCVSPLSLRPGRVSLHVSYNLQQFTDSMCFFEYHTATRFTSMGILCGPVSGGTPVTLVVQNVDGLPEDRGLVACVVRFESDKTGEHEDVDASFDTDALVIASVAPAWPSNELVSVRISLACGASAQFSDSKIKFLFYDPPQGVIKIEPSAGPISGGTEVLAWCGKIVDTGEITVSITIYRDDELLLARTSEAAAVDDSSKPTLTPTPVTMLVKGKIVGEAVTFTTPAVNQPCVAHLSISLNGINYTSVHTKSTLRYIYYVEPVIRRFVPAWSPLESLGQLVISGDHIHDYGCRALVRFQLQNLDDRSCVTVKVVDGFFPNARTGGDALTIAAPSASISSAALSTLECNAQSIPPGCYEVEISLNGQQFSKSNYMSAKYGNYAGTACTALLPFRCFATPFFLATPTGPAAGGSAVILFMAKKLAKMLTKESKCQVQFAPLRASDTTALVQASQKTTAAQSGLDPIHTIGEIDHASGKITCRAPLLRSACAAALDVILPLSQETKAAASTAASAYFSVKDRERYYSYESPTITEITPTCGPTSGGTTLVIEGTNLLDTGQIFVRFRSSLNDREFVILPGAYSRTFPDGSISCTPLIICKTPSVEIVDKVMTTDAASGTGAHGSASTPRHKDALTGRARTHTFQQLAEQGVRLQQRQSGAAASRVLKVARMVTKPGTKASAAVDAVAHVNVLVDFTLNAGEQFIAHSATFHYYVEADPSDISWAPRHLPTRSLDRAPLETRQIAVQLPKSYRLNDAPERICIRFEGGPQPIFWKNRRGMSAVLHETGVARELLMLDLSKFKAQSTMRRRSTYFRNSSISASSNNILSSSGASDNVLSMSVKARPPSSSRLGGTDSDDSARSARGAARQVVSQSQTPSPYVSGKVVRMNELTCPIPDFSCPGAVRVFLSLNAQQFICIGELYIHNPVSIKEDDKYRFCSNIGGDPFMLNCSPSTIFSYLLPQCVTNEAQYSERMFDHATVKASRALLLAGNSTASGSDSDSDDGDDGTNDSEDHTKSDAAANVKIHATIAGVAPSLQPRAGGSGVTVLKPAPPRPLLSQMSHRASLRVSSAWREREFHVVQVHLVPAQPRLFKKIVVSVSRVDSQIEIGTSVPDDSGCCVFEITDWGSEMLLKATPPLGTSYAAYSAIIREGTAYRQEQMHLASRPHTSENASPPLSRKGATAAGLACSSHILMVQHAPKDMLQIVALSASATERMNVVLVACSGKEGDLSTAIEAEVVPVSGTVNGETAPDESDSPQLACVAVDPKQLAPGHQSFCVCIKVQPLRDGASGTNPNDDCGGSHSHAPLLRSIQVALSDHLGVRLFLSGVAHEQRGWWVVAHAAFESETQALRVTSIDCLVASLDDAAFASASASAVTSSLMVTGDGSVDGDTHYTQDAASLLPRGVPSASRIVTASICFACADSSRNLSCSSEARLILPGASDLASFMAATLLVQEVKLECAMPELPFSGPTVLTVTFAGTIFSNAICIQCYDPRTWRITAIDPPCGLVRQDVALRVEGENFIENRKILVRLSDAVRYVNVTATVEKIHLLILRVAAIKHLRALLQSLGLPGFSGSGMSASSTTSAASATATSAQRRDDECGPLPLASITNFTLTLRIECGKQTEFATCREVNVLAVLSSASVLSWEEQYEIQVLSKQSCILLTLEISDTSLPRPLEIARAVVPLDALQDGVMARKTFMFEEHFRKGRQLAAPVTGSTASTVPPAEIDLMLHLSPPMLNANVVVCKLQPLQTPQRLCVQISSGDSFYSTCAETRNTAAAVQRGYSSWYQVYELPRVVETTPKVLPRSAGGEVAIHGSGFIDCDGSNKIVVRLFACAKPALTGAEEHAILAAINRVTRVERRCADFFMRDVDARFVSPTQLACIVPPHLATYNVYYRLSFDGRAFTEATPASHVLLFSVDAITPRGGPVTGNTYAALQGTNISACMARWDLAPIVRLKWVRRARELESVTVPGEFYHAEDVVYFYSPQSKFGLANITAHIDLCLCTKRELESTTGALAGTVSAASASGAPQTSLSSQPPQSPLPPMPAVPLRFGQDEIPFVMYKAPTIKLIAPTLALVCGLSTLELVVQGLDEKAALSLRHVHKTRFKRRGQMQVSDAQLVGDGKFVCLVPRFNVSSAVATPLSTDAIVIVAAPSPAVALPAPQATSPQRNHAHGGVMHHRVAVAAPSGPLKIWNRDAGIYVSLLRARNLHVSKKHTCNPFAVVSCSSKVRLKSTRKEGTFKPVWNELFDFEWRDTVVAPIVRVVIENQLTIDQSEIVGSVDISFATLATAAVSAEGASDATFSRAFSLRAWFPLRKKLGRHAVAADDADQLYPHKGHPSQQQQHASSSAAPALGDVELAISYIPARAQVPKRSAATSKFSSILSVITSKKIQQHQSQSQHRPHLSLEDAGHRKKEKILSRLFRHQGAAHASIVPNELLVELALNGQDFWSVAPHRCYLTPAPIVVNVEPAFIAINGGTQMHIFGMNFANTAVLRVAFAFVSAGVAPAGATVKALVPARAQQQQPPPRVLIDAACTVVVDAKHRSTTCISCVTPSLEAIAPLGAADVAIYVSTNGVDFESVSLPQQHTTVLELQTESDSRVEEDNSSAGGGSSHSPRRRGEDSAAIVADRDGYVVHLDKLLGSTGSLNVKAGSTSMSPPPKTARDAEPAAMLVLTRQVHLYLIPTIVGVKPSDGIYTSRLTIEGRDFTRTNVAVARFCSKSDAADVRTSRVSVLSSERMECELPDFPRGTVVKTFVAINGVEFFACPGELVVFQSPRITEVVPNWISATTNIKLKLRGINFTTQSLANTAVQVSFARGATKRTVQGSCVDGEVLCAIPPELLLLQPSAGTCARAAPAPVPAAVAEMAPRSPDASTRAARSKAKEDYYSNPLILAPPIMVDVWLGGVHKTFTGMAVPLHVYSEVPAMHAIAPMNGPIYGGFALDIDGKGFINTGSITVRFELLQEELIDASARAVSTTVSTAAAAVVPNQTASSLNVDAQLSVVVPDPIVVDARADFVSSERLLCIAPTFPHEGVYMVSVALNGTEFSRISATTWFLAWQNWQRRKLLLTAHGMFSHPLRRDGAVTVASPGQSNQLAAASATWGAAATVASPLVDDELHILRRKGSFMLAPQCEDAAGGDVRLPLIHRPRARASVMRTVMQYYEQATAEAGELADLKLLHWHPASAADEKGRSLLSLLESLCNTPETQPILCRRIAIVFQRCGKQLKTRELADAGRDGSDDSGDDGDGDGARKSLVLHYSGFAEGMRWMFPHALERELEDLWSAVDRKQRGYVSYYKVMQRLVHKERSQSPEPGPTHYTPQFSVVESKSVAAVILPETVESEPIAGLPSELFMDYDAFKAVKPRAVAAIFPRRKVDASWCNPVVREPYNAAPDEHLGEAGNAASGSQTPRGGGVQSQSQTTVTSGGQVIMPRPPRHRESGQTSLAAAAAGPGGRRAKNSLSAAPRQRTSDSSGSNSAGDGLRANESLDDGPSALGSSISKESSARSPHGASRAQARTFDAAAVAATRSSFSAMNPSSGRNLFYSDIAPLYLKFLTSKEVQKFMKQ